ncbi:MAG TPA: VOC family protein [Ktedonobacteraceae bacterium]|jgi:lactoylglutathione lyase
MQLQKPDYIVIYVSDMERSTAFYRDILGLPLRFTTPGWTEFDLGSMKLALHRSGVGAAPEQPGRPPAGVAHLAFVVQNIQSVYEDLQARGAHFSMAPEKQVTGNTLAVLHDPDGFGITIQQQG